jgi:hypothetical protein
MNVQRTMFGRRRGGGVRSAMTTAGGDRTAGPGRPDGRNTSDDDETSINRAGSGRESRNETKCNLLYTASVCLESMPFSRTSCGTLTSRQEPYRVEAINFGDPVFVQPCLPRFATTLLFCENDVVPTCPRRSPKSEKPSRTGHLPVYGPVTNIHKRAPRDREGHLLKYY